MREDVNIFWFRRDLRLQDNKGLFNALTLSNKLLPVFIYDKDEDTYKNSLRKEFIFQCLQQIDYELQKINRGLIVLYGKAPQVFKNLSSSYHIAAIFANKDHEPFAIETEKEVAQFCTNHQIEFHTYLDHLLMEKSEVSKPDHSPYTIFTPYKIRFKQLLNDQHLMYFPSEDYLDHIVKADYTFPEPEELGIQASGIEFPQKEIPEDIIEKYHKTRDFPSKNGTSRLGLHLRYGTISIRKLARLALKLNEIYLNELIWREFFAMIMWHFPHLISHSFKPKYDYIQWLNNEDHFQKWKEGKTGYPLVDAGMRELKQTGYMHNRVRMVTASFLTKHLLIDWRWGENWFAENLIDYELSSNNGSWQWATGSGCDAAPYFRIFNPIQQQKKFDPKEEYLRKWIPEIHTSKYPSQIVDHQYARDRCLQIFKESLNAQV